MKKISRNPQYEAGFIRSIDDDDPSPEVAPGNGLFGKALVVVVLIAIVAATTAGVVAAVQWRQDSPGKQLARAKALVAAQSHGPAVAELKRSLLGDPQQPDVRFLLGQELLLLGDPVGAEIEFGKALDGGFDPEQATPLLVAAMAREGKYEQIVKTVNRAKLRSREANADLQAALGSAYLVLGKEADAKAAWHAAKDFVPTHSGTLIAEARYLADGHRYDEAAELLDRIPAGAPRQNESQSLRGDIARATGQRAAAVAAYEASLAIQPGDLEVRSNLALSLVDTGQLDAAHRQIAQVLAAKPKDPQAQYIDAVVYFSQKDYPRAQAAITQSIQLRPNDGKGFLLAGTIARQLDQLLVAEQDLSEAVHLMPQNVEARRLLADLYVQRHEAQKADETLKPLRETMASDAAVADIAAKIALLQNDGARAAAAYDQVRPVGPDGVHASLAGAALKIAAGDSAGAIARLRAASAANPGDADIDAALVGAYLAAHQVDEALAAWKRIDAKDPGSARNDDLLASIDLARHDPTAARGSLQKALAIDPGFFPAVSRLALLDASEGRVDAARAVLQPYIATHPGHTEAILALVRIENTPQGNPDVVKALLRDARKSSPTSTRVVLVQSAFYAGQGDTVKARAVLDEGLAFAPSDLDLLQNAGDLASAAKDYPGAIRYYARLSSLNSESTDRLVQLGQAQLQILDTESALGTFKNAVVRLPGRTDLQATLVASLIAAGLPDDASRLLFEIARVAPKSPVIPELDADIKLAQKNMPEAIAAYRRALDATPTPHLAIKLYQAYMTARERDEATAFLTAWIDAHPKEPTVRLFAAEQAKHPQD